jgi:hypothetical protein
MRRFILTLVFFFAGLTPVAFSGQDAVESGLRQFVDAGGASGLVAAMVTPDGTDFFSYGSISADPKRKLDEHTQFAVASISLSKTSAKPPSRPSEEPIPHSPSRNRLSSSRLRNCRPTSVNTIMKPLVTCS